MAKKQQQPIEITIKNKQNESTKKIDCSAAIILQMNPDGDKTATGCLVVGSFVDLIQLAVAHPDIPSHVMNVAKGKATEERKKN